MRETLINFKMKAIDMWLKYKETGNEIYKILAEYYDDISCD